MMQAHIVVRTLPLTRDYNEGEIVTLVENGKEFRMQLIEDVLKGEREVKAIPLDKVPH